MVPLKPLQNLVSQKNKKNKTQKYSFKLSIDSGVARVTIYECRGLKEGTNSYVRLIMNGSEKKRTNTVKKNSNPKYEMPCEVVILDKTSVFVRVEVKDDETLLGCVTCQWMDMMRQTDDDGWWDLLQDGSSVGQIRLGVEWKPMMMNGISDAIGSHGFDSKLVYKYNNHSVESIFIYHRTGYWCCSFHFLGSTRSS